MHRIYEVLRRTSGLSGGTLVAATNGTVWESPRGLVSIDPDRCDIVPEVYAWIVEKVDGEPYKSNLTRYGPSRIPVEIRTCRAAVNDKGQRRERQSGRLNK
jgi:hypothetical protein